MRWWYTIIRSYFNTNFNYQLAQMTLFQFSNTPESKFRKTPRRVVDFKDPQIIKLTTIHTVRPKSRRSSSLEIYVLSIFFFSLLLIYYYTPRSKVLILSVIRFINPALRKSTYETRVPRLWFCIWPPPGPDTSVDILPAFNSYNIAFYRGNSAL